MNRNSLTTVVIEAREIVSRAFFCALYAIFLIVTPGCDRFARFVKPDPVPAQCSAECFIPCDTPMDLADGSGDTLLAVSKVNRAYLVRCSVRREACAQCLDRLKQARGIQ